MLSLMMTVVIALISFAVAFVAGGVLSKAYLTMQFGTLQFGRPDQDERDRATDGRTGDSTEMIDRATHQRTLNMQRARYRKRVLALNKVISRHEEAQEQIREKLHEIQRAQGSKAKSASQTRIQTERLREKTSDLCAQLAARDTELAGLHDNFKLLQKAHDVEQQKSESAQGALNLVQIERDELTARISRLEGKIQTRLNAVDDQDGPNHATVAANLRAKMGEMRECLAGRDRQIHNLEMQSRESQTQLGDLEIRLESWKQRVSPLTRKLTQQRNVIRRLREPEDEADSTTGQAIDEPRRPLDELIDDLKEISGIGPALERRLNLQGIRRFEQIAELTESQLANIAKQIAIAPTIMQRDRWIEQARSLAERHQT